MASKFEIRPKGRITLVGLEIIALGLMVTAILKDKYSFDPFMAIICSISGSLVVSALFFFDSIVQICFFFIFLSGMGLRGISNSRRYYRFQRCLLAGSWICNAFFISAS
jgi:hypothetical protein